VTNGDTLVACTIAASLVAGLSISVAGCRSGPADPSRRQEEAGDHSESKLTTPGVNSPDAASDKEEPLQFAMVEWAEADTIHAVSLWAISIEANEIRCPHITRTRSFPVPKDMGWRRIEGHEVQLRTLWAHHVRARLIVADKINATSIRKLAKPYVWSGGTKVLVRNRIVRVDPGTGAVVP
jgi:hypothetical protein